MESAEQKLQRMWSKAIERKKRYLREMLMNSEDERHGTSRGYFYGCRCRRCKKAGSDYQRRRKKC